MAPRLKVFVTSDGLTDYVVATSSKPKALEAWGSHQDLFKTGLARETDEAGLIEAALAQPGKVLRRPASSRDVLENLPAARLRKPVAKASAAPKAERPPRGPPKLELVSPPPAPKEPSKAALRKVADLEKKLAAADKAFARERDDLEARRRKLEKKVAALEASHEAERRRLEAALSVAKRALEE